MKKIFLSLVLFPTFLGIKLMAQSTNAEAKANNQSLQVDQTAISVIDANPGAEAPVDGYVFNENGELVKSKVQITGHKITIKKADYDVLPMEKQTLIKDDQASFIIIE